MTHIARPVRVDLARLPLPGGYSGLREVWDDLDRYRVLPRPYGYPENIVRLWAPVDAIHQALIACVRQSRWSVVAGMFGWNDSELNDLFLMKLDDERVFVQLSLDSRQAKGLTAVPLIQKWGDRVGNSLSIGHSSYGGITHIKEFVLDGVLTIGGSTNMSIGGEGFDPEGHGAQDNEFYLVWDPVYAAETRARLDIVHDSHLVQMAARRAA